jgi:hypothetical protein
VPKLLGVILGPARQCPHGTEQCLAQLRQPVLDAGRRAGEATACDQAVVLEAPQRLGQHLLADPADALHQLAMPARPLAQRGYDDDRPRVGDQRERRARGAVGEEDVVNDDRILRQRCRHFGEATG